LALIDIEESAICSIPRLYLVCIPKFNSQLRKVELAAIEWLHALNNAQEQGIQGGRVYDYFHAPAAAKANADVLLTRNDEDFRSLSKSVPVEWP
jgi:hypothetical protein